MATHVLVHRNCHVSPLAPLYNSPYAVLQRSLHTFTIQMGDWEEVEVVSTSAHLTCYPHCHIGAAGHLGQ